MPVSGATPDYRCDCVHIPTDDSDPDDLRVNPGKLFTSMTAVEQDRVFTKAGVEAIRLGADINQVVNVRRGALGLTSAGARITEAEAQALRGGADRGRLQTTRVFGRDLFITPDGITTRGTAGRRLGVDVDGKKARGARYRSAKTPRLMPESILQIAGTDRAEALRLLKRFGYLT